MARTPKAQQAPQALPNFEPDVQYRIKLKRAIKRGGALLRPFDDIVVKGKVASEFVDAIETAERL